MNDPAPDLVAAWKADPGVILGCVAVIAVYAAVWRRRARWPWFVAAVVVVVLAELSPIRVLAAGVLFSAHMLQHLMLLLIAPALFILSLPAPKVGRGVPAEPRTAPDQRDKQALAYLGWPAGVGAMWLWHVPLLCDAAVAMPWVRAMQSVSLLALGTLFWWPILAPRPQERLSPPMGIGYLFTACLACSALGILITLTSLEVCSSFTSPAYAVGPWGALRERVGALRDRQIGGLLMWVPMCLVYVSAIMLELARWFGARPNIMGREAS